MGSRHRRFSLSTVNLRILILNSPPCAKSSTFRPVSAETRSEPSSGRSSVMNTELMPLEATTEPVIFSLRESMFTTIKQRGASMSPELSSLIWNPVPWTVSDQVLLDRSSGPITLSLGRVELETTGQRATTQKELNWWTQFLMWSEKKPKTVTASRDSN